MNYFEKYINGCLKFSINVKLYIIDILYLFQMRINI